MDKQIGPLRAVVFDAYGTLFDVYSVGLLAEQLFPGQGNALSLLWRDKQIEYTRLTSMGGRYRPFWDLTRAGLRYAALRLNLPLDDAAEALRGEAQAGAGQVPERPVLAAHRAQPGVLDLLVAPQHGEPVPVTGEELFGQQPDAVDVEQRAVRVEQHGAWHGRGISWPGLHARNLFHADSNIKSAESVGFVTPTA